MLLQYLVKVETLKNVGLLLQWDITQKIASNVSYSFIEMDRSL